MKQQIESFQSSVGKLMQDNLAKGDFEAVTLLSPILSRIQDLKKRYIELERDVSEIETALDGVKGKSTSQKVAELVPQLGTRLETDRETGRGRPQTLKISIDWKANKRNRESEEICENTAAASMAVFVGRLIHEFGSEAVQKLERVRINRGPLLSKTPVKDFVNQSQGILYGHKKIRGSDYYILTHSQTSQKVDDLNKVCRILGLIPGSVQIEQVSRDAWLKDLIV